MANRIPWQLWLIAVALFLGPSVLAGAETFPPLEDELVGMRLGSTVEALQGRYPGLYKHRLAMGEFLYEACNQKDLEVFNFTEEPWSKGKITYVSLRRETKESVCRDATGALPDLAIAPETPRKLHFGDSKATVLVKYGAPSRERSLPDGRTILSYERSGGGGLLVDHLTLAVTVKDDRVVGISLSGDVPGAKKPF